MCGWRTHRYACPCECAVREFIHCERARRQPRRFNQPIEKCDNARRQLYDRHSPIHHSYCLQKSCCNKAKSIAAEKRNIKLSGLSRWEQWGEDATRYRDEYEKERLEHDRCTRKQQDLYHVGLSDRIT